MNKLLGTTKKKLIAAGIIVVVAAIVVVTQSGGVELTPEQIEANLELESVDKAMKQMIEAESLDFILPRSHINPVRDWTEQPKTVDGKTVLPLAKYLGSTSTEWGYCWNSTGGLRQTSEKHTSQCPRASQLGDTE